MASTVLVQYSSINKLSGNLLIHKNTRHLNITETIGPRRPKALFYHNIYFR